MIRNSSLTCADSVNTDDDLREIDGKREKLAGRLQARYGWDRTRIDREMDNFRGGQA